MKSGWRFPILASVVALVSIVTGGPAAYAAAATPSVTLAAPESFSSIADPDKRSAALFT